MTENMKVDIKKLEKLNNLYKMKVDFLLNEIYKNNLLIQNETKHT
jgi:hypothetical protein